MSPVDRNSVLAASLVVVTLVLGIVSGVALDRWLLRPRAELRIPEVELPRGPMRGRLDPGEFRERLNAQLTAELRLTAEQRTKVDSILRVQQQKSRQVMEEVRPRLQQLTESTQAAIRDVLTLEQQQQLNKLREERIRRRRGSMGPEIRERR